MIDPGKSGPRLRAVPAWAWMLLPALAFLLLHFTSWTTPGVYMDAVNPDYMVVALLGESRGNVPLWLMPGNLIAGRFPILVQIYHGSLPYYLGLPAYAVFGTGLFGIRAAGAVFGVVILLALAVFARGLRVPALAAAGGLAILATDPAFILGLRTQFYIKMIPTGLVLAAIGLMAGQPSSTRAMVAGVLAGLAVHGYFIHAFPVGAITLALLVWPGLAWRGKLGWILGLAIGVTPTILGFALMFDATGGWEDFQRYFGQAVQAQSPGRSGLGIQDRLDHTLRLAYLAWSGAGARIVALGEAAAMPLREVRLLALAVVLACGAAAFLFVERLRRPAALLLMALVGWVALGMVFGDRLWAHHFSPITIVFAAGAVLALAVLQGFGSWGAWIAGGLTVVLVASNLAAWRLTLEALNESGGRGLSSDAIMRFAEDVETASARLAVVPVDWGVFMPLAMVTRGAVPIHTDFDPRWIRHHLCSGRDVVVPIVAERQSPQNAARASVSFTGPSPEAPDWRVALTARQQERVESWVEQLGLGVSDFRRYATRDGRPVLEVITWRASAAAC